MSGIFTDVELVWFRGEIERWIRFGRIADERFLDRRRRVVRFAPGSVFAFVRWQANDHGTVLSRLDILRAAPPGTPIATVPGVNPGGEILLRAAGWEKVERVLQAIDAVESLAIDPADASPEHWRHVHNRLCVGERPRRYTLEQHRAWLLRQRIYP